MRITVLLAVAGFVSATSSGAATVLGASSDFAVFGGSSVTNAGPTVIRGDLGVGSATPVTGAGSIVLVGTTHVGDAAAEAGQAAAQAAFTTLSERPVTADLSGQDLGMLGLLTPGVYNFASSAQLTGALTLDFGGDPARDFVFVIGSTLTTATGSSVTVLNGGGLSGVYFVVGSSATLGTGTRFAGNILATQNITLTTGTSICGRALALAGAVTLDTVSVSNDAVPGVCVDFGSRGFSGGGAAPVVGVPEPSSWALLVTGFAAAGTMLRRQRRRIAA